MASTLLTPSPRLARHLDERVVRARVAGAAVAGVLRRGPDDVTEGAVAAAGSAHLDTPFDLASVSKPFLALSVGLLVEQGALRWETPLAELLPQLEDCPAGAETLEALLSHRAGLVPHLELFRDAWAGAPFVRSAALRRAALGRRPDGQRDALYSDLGYLLVGAGLEAAFGRPLDVLLTEKLLAPLGLEVGSARSWRKRPEFERRVAPTEVQPGRGGVLVGQVHDDNAWALAGHGWAGHAGGFGTLRGLLELGAALLRASAGQGFLAGVLSRLVTRRPGGSLLLGFDSPSGPGSLAGPGASPSSFGHLGFTGTSLWCDPDAGLCTVLLTNRVHPTRDNPRIRAARLETQELLWQLGRALGEPRGAEGSAVFG